MIIKTTKTREERIAKARAFGSKLIEAGLFDNPKFKDPEGITAFCGPLKTTPRFQQTTAKSEQRKVIFDLRNLVPSKRKIAR